MSLFCINLIRLIEWEKLIMPMMLEMSNMSLRILLLWRRDSLIILEIVLLRDLEFPSFRMRSRYSERYQQPWSSILWEIWKISSQDPLRIRRSWVNWPGLWLWNSSIVKLIRFWLITWVRLRMDKAGELSLESLQRSLLRHFPIIWLKNAKFFLIILGRILVLLRLKVVKDRNKSLL